MTEDDKAVVASLEQRDVVRIAEAVFRMLPAAPPVPPPAPPSGVITGADVKALQHPDTDLSAMERVVSIILAAKGMTRDQITEYVALKTAAYRNDKEIDERCRIIVQDELADIGLPIKDEKAKEKTGDALRSTLKWQRRIEVAGNTVIGGLILTAFYAIAKLIGIKLPNPPGMGG